MFWFFFQFYNLVYFLFRLGQMSFTEIYGAHPLIHDGYVWVWLSRHEFERYGTHSALFRLRSANMQLYLRLLRLFVIVSELGTLPVCGYVVKNLV